MLSITFRQELLQGKHIDEGLIAVLSDFCSVKVVRVAEAFEYGMIGIAIGSISIEAFSFSGIRSGFWGGEDCKNGMESHAELKYRCRAVGSCCLRDFVGSSRARSLFSSLRNLPSPVFPHAQLRRVGTSSGPSVSAGISNGDSHKFR